jgi:hypothetical protein
VQEFSINGPFHEYGFSDFQKGSWMDWTVFVKVYWIFKGPDVFTEYGFQKWFFCSKGIDFLIGFPG